MPSSGLWDGDPSILRRHWPLPIRGLSMVNLHGLRAQRILTSLFPSDTTHDSIRIVINTHDEEERDRLTEQWQTHKLEELNFIGIVVRNTYFPYALGMAAHLL